MTRTPQAERLLIDWLNAQAGSPETVLCTTLGRAQGAAAAARKFPDADVCCLFLDLYALSESNLLADNDRTNLRLLCETDLPDVEADLVLMPVSARGEAELVRELLQQGHQRLCVGGRLLAATDNRNDTWLHEELRRLFPKVTREASRYGVAYAASKTGPLKKERRFEGRFAFRDAGRMVQAMSRPGVFSHRRLDTGARALLEVMQINAGDRVFEIGSGCGAISAAAALRADGVSVYAVDSNPRAVQCTRLTADANGIASLQAELNADAACDQPGTFDVIVTNPPYFSRGRLSELFLHGGVRALKPGGRLYVVSKRGEWYAERLQRDFSKIDCVACRSYNVVTAIGLRRGGRAAASR